MELLDLEFVNKNYENRCIKNFSSLSVKCILSDRKYHIKEFPHQVAGHRDISMLSLTVLPHENNGQRSDSFGECNHYILKPMLKAELFTRELAFYTEIEIAKKQHDKNSTENSRAFNKRSNIDASIRCVERSEYLPFIPRYFGVSNVVKASLQHHCSGSILDDVNKIIIQPEKSFFLMNDESHKIESSYAVLQDLTKGFKHRNIMDIKIGLQTFEPNAPKTKIQAEKNKYPLQESLGFRISGAKMFCHEEGIYKHWDKYFGRSLSSEDKLKEAFNLFFQRRFDGPFGFENQVCSDIVDSTLYQLEQIILPWMEKQRKYKFYSSSVLIIFDKDISKQKPAKVKVSMIDFAHVTINENSDLDSNYITGLKNLISILRCVN